MLDLLVDVLALLLAVGDRSVHELRVLGLLGCGEDQGWVGGGILRLVLANGGEVTAVTDDSLESSSVSKMPDRAFKGRGGYRQPLIVRQADVTYGAGGLQLVKRGRHGCGDGQVLVVCEGVICCLE